MSLRFLSIVTRNSSIVQNWQQLETVKQVPGLPRLQETSQILCKILKLMKHSNLAKQMICFCINACGNSVRNILTPPPAPTTIPAPTSIHPHTYSPPAPLTSPLAQGGSTITIGQIPGINPETQQHLQWIKQQIHLTEQITGSTTVKLWY